LVVKRTSYERNVLGRKSPRTKRLLAEHNPVVSRMLSTHESHARTLDTVLGALDALGAEVTLIKATRALTLPRGYPFVITVGGDGTLLSASHHVGAHAQMLGINSAPESSVGFFCAADASSARALLERAFSGKLPAVPLQRMRVERNGRVLSRRVLNEVLFCHASPAATSRYILQRHRASARGSRTLETEEQKSSGLWIGPAAGSTAAQKSAGGRVLPLRSRSIQYVVREPYEPIGKVVRMRRGLIQPGEKLTLQSKMQDARLFIDGHESVHTIAIGDELTLSLSDDPLHLLGLRAKR
jgi:NAD+ kinase